MAKSNSFIFYSLLGSNEMVLLRDFARKIEITQSGLSTLVHIWTGSSSAGFNDYGTATLHEEKIDLEPLVAVSGTVLNPYDIQRAKEMALMDCLKNIDIGLSTKRLDRNAFEEAAIHIADNYGLDTNIILLDDNTCVLANSEDFKFYLCEGMHRNKRYVFGKMVNHSPQKSFRIRHKEPFNADDL